MALDRSKRPPRSVARQATFLGETQPRAARPLGASLLVRQLGAIRKACQRNPSPRFVPMPIGPAAGGNNPALAKRGKAFSLAVAYPWPLLAVALGVVSYGPRLQLRVTVWAVRESLHGRRTSSMQAVSFPRCRSLVGA